jgi:hypothetical protein
VALTDDFFEGFFAVLRLRDQEFVETRDNVHHERFRAVASLLQRVRADHLDGSDELPRAFKPTMATGLYSELDDALLRFQQGYGRSPNPSYPGLKLVLTNQQAQDVLLDFSPAAQKLLGRVADAFLEAQPTTRAVGVPDPV